MLLPNWKPILNDLEKERAVLLIGPDFLPYEGASIAMNFYEHVKPLITDQEAVHFFEREGLFLFDTPLSKVEAQKEAESFYNGLPIEESLLRLIAELPFPLIISVNPDLTLSQFFTRHQLNFQFDYFSSKNKLPGNISRPTAASPLIYNLCGSIEDYQSLVLDFDDRFDLLKNLLADFGVSPLMSDVLLKATTYVFIGFQFDKWYTQLLLRYLNKNKDRFSNTKKNYATKTVISDDDTRIFFQQQFNLTIYGGDWQFLNTFHQEYAGTKKIRPLLDAVSSGAVLVRRLVQLNNIEAALERLEEYSIGLSADDQDEIIVHRSNYNAWSTDVRNGTVSQENLDIKIARIRKGILDLTQKLP